MSSDLQLALLGALPALLAMGYVDRLDAKRPEPRQTLRRVALAGAASALPVILIGTILRWLGPDQTGGYRAAIYTAFVVAAIPEEAAKLGSMLAFAWRRPEFDERMDGIVYGARAGLGFALVENVGYLMLIPESFDHYLTVFVARAVLAVPGHATWGAIIGYFAARRRFDHAGPGLVGGYLIAVVLHGTYDALLFASPVALARGHTWVGLGASDSAILAYFGPTLIILLGVWAVLRLSQRAVEADDRAEAAARSLSRRW